MSTLTIPPPALEKLHITVWSDPVIDRMGHDPRSRYVERFWLGVMGPSTVLLLRHCAAELDGAPDGFDLDLVEVAGALGVGHKGGRNSPLARSLGRACRFGAARALTSDQLQVRRRIPPLTRNQVTRLPPRLQREHEQLLEAELRMDDAALRRRARRLALGLVECGDRVDDAELQLGQWRFHPSIAADAVRWAWDLHHGTPPDPAENPGKPAASPPMDR